MNVKLMKRLCKYTQKNAIIYLGRFLKKYYENVKVTNRFIIAEGTIPICLVAHLDTVFPNPPSEIYFDEEQNVMWSPDGLGADDRAGVYAIVRLIQMGHRPHIVLTTDEEIGGIGARALIDVFPECPFQECNFLIELDRQGEQDCVFYRCANELFEDKICDYGFVTAFGTFSDISIIAPQWGIAAVNLSIGYIDEHSRVERLHLDWTEATIEKVSMMFTDAMEEESSFSYAYVEAPMPAADWSWWVPNQTNETFATNTHCLICTKKLGEHPNKIMTNTDYFYVCDDCYKQYYEDDCPTPTDDSLIF